MFTSRQSLGSHVAFTVTNLTTLASSATAGWKSAFVDNTTILAEDYELNMMFTMPATSPANDKAVYIYLYAGYYDGSTWYYADGGTATAIDGNEGTYTIASPNNLVLFEVLNYTTASMVIKMGGRYIARAFGGKMPDGWGIVVVNYTGATFSAAVAHYKAYTETIT